MCISTSSENTTTVSSNTTSSTDQSDTYKSVMGKANGVVKMNGTSSPNFNPLLFPIDTSVPPPNFTISPPSSNYLLPLPPAPPSDPNARYIERNGCSSDRLKPTLLTSTTVSREYSLICWNCIFRLLKIRLLNILLIRYY
jgi:hypothetical protein